MTRPSRLTDSSVTQWIACVETFRVVPPAVVEALTRRWAEDPPEALTDWHRRFQQDLLASRNGYPLHGVSSEPYTETEAEALLTAEGLLQDCPPRLRKPTLCLSHDIDYLTPTLPMILKRMVAQRTLRAYPPGTQFLDSLERLLALDQAAAGGVGASTLFIPHALRSPTPLRWPAQWLIDPSYHRDHREFGRLQSLISEYQCEVGLHGSFFSLQDGYIEQEREELSRALGRPIGLSRQHWLNLPVPDALWRLKQEGLTLDSTLGWNGGVGFRGGMARPFPVVFQNGERLWEIPLVLMDGPLFDDLGLDTEAVVAHACQLLTTVLQRGGCVSINWHERAAFPDYAWDAAYEKILTWAKAQGFDFRNFTQAMESHGAQPETVPTP